MSQDAECLYPRNEMAKDQILPMSQTSGVSVSSPYAPKTTIIGPLKFNDEVNAPCSIPLLLGPENTKTICPFCNSNIKTSVKYRSTTRTHISAALCCLICCCCCIPYCLDSAKNTDHYCPSCSSFVGTYEK